MKMPSTSEMTIRRTIRTSAFVGAATLVVSLLSFLKNLFAARSFGISGAMDAFNIVIALPNLFAGVLFGALQASLVPVLVGYRETVSPWLADRLVTLLVWRVAAIAVVSLRPMVTRYGRSHSTAQLTKCQRRHRSRPRPH